MKSNPILNHAYNITREGPDEEWYIATILGNVDNWGPQANREALATPEEIEQARKVLTRWLGVFA